MMTLTKDDLGKIGKVVDERIIKERKHTERLMDKKLDGHRDKMIKYMKVRFDELQTQINDIKTELKMINVHLNSLENKIDQIKKMESEDIEKAYREIEKIKKKVVIMENKLAMIK